MNRSIATNELRVLTGMEESSLEQILCKIFDKASLKEELSMLNKNLEFVATPVETPREFPTFEEWLKGLEVF